MKHSVANRYAEARKTVRHWRWHRLFGLVAAVPFLIIALSGGLLACKSGLGPLLPASWGDPWPVVYKIHRSLLAGEPGKWVVSLLGVSLWAMWWTGRRMAKVNGRRPKSWHLRLGRWTGVTLAVICTLGALLNFRGPLGDWLDPVGSLDPQHPAAVVAPEIVEEARHAAALLHPEEQPASMRMPKVGQPYLLFFHDDGTRIYADPSSGQIVKVRTNWSHWTNALLTLHSLEVLGVVGAWLSAGLAVVLLLLSAQGVLKMSRKFNRAT